MRFTYLIKLFLLGLCSSFAFYNGLSATIPHKKNAVYQNEDISLRFHAQWNIDENTQKKLCKAYGVKRIRFDTRGHPLPQGLSPKQIERWERLYTQCMYDGCLYCDAPEGSCESRTCGVNNADCKPYTGSDGQPLCGRVCADYAFKAILICNDLS